MEKFSVDLRVYPLNIVYAAAYVMLDYVYIYLEEEGDKVIVNLTSKNDEKELVEKFNEQLLNYSVYNIISKKNEGIRKSIIQRLLITNGYR